MTLYAAMSFLIQTGLVAIICAGIYAMYLSASYLLMTRKRRYPRNQNKDY